MVQAIALAALMLAGSGERTARLHFKEAEKYYAKGFYEDALDEYQKAFEAKPLPGLLFNMGQCHRNLGHYQEAIDAFKRYLAQKPDAGNHESVELLIKELTQKQESLEASRNKPAPTPAPAPNERPAASATRAALTPQDPGDSPLPRVRPEATQAVEAGVTESATPYYKRWWFWTAVGVVAAGAGVGIYYATRHSTEIDNATLPGFAYP